MNLKIKKILSIFKKLFIIFFVWSVLLVLVLQYVFINFSNYIFKDYIQKKINKESAGLYNLDFEAMNINFFRRTVLITNLNFTPDTVVYNNWVVTKNYSKPAYEIKLDSFYFDRLNIFNLLEIKRVLNVRNIKLIRPQIKFITSQNTDTIYERKNEYEALRKDLLPVVFKYIYSMQIDKIILSNGSFNFLINQTDSGERFSADNITVTFKNFDLNRDNYNDNQNLLYTDDVELKIDGYLLRLKDKIHTISAKNIFISTKEKKISLEHTHLLPNQIDSLQLCEIKENYMDIYFPQITLENTDFEQIYLKKIIDLKNIELSEANIKIYKKKTTKDTTKTKLDLYKLIEGTLYYFDIDTFSFANAKLEVYDNISNKKPRTSIESFTLELINFKIDSTSSNNLKTILNAENVYVYVSKFSHLLKDNIHILKADELLLSSEKQLITAKNVTLLPDNNNYSSLLYKNINNISIPKILLKGVDIAKFYNYNNLLINTFEIDYPSIDIKSFSLESENNNKQKGKDFQQNLASLTYDYLKSVYINNVILKDGDFYYEKISPKKQTLTSGKINLKLTNFKLSPQNSIIEIFSSDEMDIIFTDYKLRVPKSLHVLSIGRFEISSLKEGLFLENINIKPISDFNLPVLMAENNKSILLNINIPSFQLLESNIYSSLQQDSLKISNIDIPNASIELSVFSENKDKILKLENIQKLKIDASTKIIKAAENAKIDIFLKQIKFDSLKLSIIKRKQFVVDSLKNYAVNTINNLIISTKNVKTNDTIHIELNEIENIAINSFNFLRNPQLNKLQVDSVFLESINSIQFINISHNDKILNRDEIYEIIGSFLNVIDIDKLTIDNGLLIFNKQKFDKKTELFRNSFSINLFDFYFNYDSIQTENRFLFSKNIDVKLKDYTFNLKDNVHKIVIKEIDFSTEKSVLNLNMITLSPYLSKAFSSANLIYAMCPQVVISNIDMLKIYNEQEVDISNLKIVKPFIILIKNDDIKKDTISYNKLTKILLPNNIKKLGISNLEVDSGRIKIIQKSKDIERELVQTDFNINLYDFLIDSITYISKNPLGIPIKSFSFNLYDFNFYLKDNIHFIKAQNIDYSFDTKNIEANNISITYEKKDSLILDKLNNINKSNLIDINITSINISNVDIVDIKNNKQFLCDQVFVQTPEIKIISLANKNKKDSFDITKVDLYQFTKNIFKNIEINNLNFLNSSFELYKNMNDSSKIVSIKNISGKITGIIIDKLAKDNKSKLFFADDISLKLNDFSRVTSDSAYTLKIDEMGFSTQKSLIYISSFWLKPNYDKVTLAENLYGFHKAIFDFLGKRIEIKNIDLVELINNKKIICDKITAQQLELEFYKNKAPIINYSLKQVHPVDRLRNAKNYIKIDSIFIKNSKIVYEQLNENKTESGIVTLDSINGFLANITNDKELINKDLDLNANIDFYLMGTGKTNLKLKMPLKSKNNYHEIEGKVTDMTAADLNPFTINALSVSIGSGFIKKLYFKILGNDSISTCDMRLIYTNLAFDVWNIDSLQRKTRPLISFIINRAVIKQNNTKLSSKVSVVYVHDNSHSFISNWLQPIIKGLTATLTGNKTADRVEKLLIKSDLKKQRRKLELKKLLEIKKN